MGSGKSSVGRELAKLINLDFLDIDNEILKISRYSSINELFDTLGNDKFREIEKEALYKTLEKKSRVIATGGGSLIYNNPLELKKNGIIQQDDKIILLNASFETCKARCSRSDRRPLFRDEGKAKKLFEERNPIYQNIADIIVEIDKISSKEVAKEIQSILNYSSLR